MEIKSENLILKKYQNYYFQVQGQPHILKERLCYLVIWTSKGKYRIIHFFCTYSIRFTFSNLLLF